ncbi:hypothetical protein FM109_05200 [Vibrio casei]|nr:hypothetical protein FM109_05200 [Vibrio casei]
METNIIILFNIIGLHDFLLFHGYNFCDQFHVFNDMKE